MRSVFVLIKRNTRLFFKDKGMFFTSLITPMILLVLYVTFLGDVYRDSFMSALPAGFSFSDGLMSGFVGGQLFSSLLAVCCVTVSFCSNMLMVQDKVTGAARDMAVTPVRGWVTALSYYLATLLSTLIICFVATGACFLYLANVGWYLSLTDVLWLLLDICLLVMFGTALSSIINFFLSTQGQISAVGTVVSAGYGFISGAYMPISQFGEGLQNVLSFFPGTYGTALLRNHAMGGVFAKMETEGTPPELIEGLMATVDCTPTFFGTEVSMGAMYLILGGTVLGLMGIYVGLNVWKSRRCG